MHAMMAYKRVRLYLHSFLNSGLNEGVWAASSLGRFVLDEQFQYPLNGRLSGTQSRAKRFKNKKIFSLARIQITDMLAPSLDTIPTTGSYEYMKGINTLCDKMES